MHLLSYLLMFRVNSILDPSIISGLLHVQSDTIPQ